MQGNETGGVQNNNETTYHPNTTTPIDGVFNGLQKRKRKGRDYIYRYSFNAHIVHHTMTQLLLKSRIKRFKQAAEKAAKAEFEQPHMRESFKPEQASNLTEDQKTAALESLMFLKEKQDGTIKVHSVADG